MEICIVKISEVWGIWGFHHCTTKDWKSKYFFSIFNFPVWMSLCTWLPHIDVYSREKCTRIWSSAVVAPSPQGSLLCACWDAFFVHHSCKEWLSYSLLPGSSNQTSHVSLAFLIHNAFPSTKVLFTSFFIIFFHTVKILENSNPL